MKTPGRTHVFRWVVLPVVLALAGCGRSTGVRSGSAAEGELLRLTPHPTGDGGVALIVENVSDQTLLLSRELAIVPVEISGASHDEGELTDYGIPASSFFLISDCSQSTRGCLSLAPEEEMRTVAWTGYYAEPQCPRDAPSDYAAPTGRYRFVVTACSGGHRFESPPFEFSGNPSP